MAAEFLDGPEPCEVTPRHKPPRAACHTGCARSSAARCWGCARTPYAAHAQLHTIRAPVQPSCSRNTIVAGKSRVLIGAGVPWRFASCLQRSGSEVADEIALEMRSARAVSDRARGILTGAAPSHALPRGGAGLRPHCRGNRNFQQFERIGRADLVMRRVARDHDRIACL